MSKRFAKSMGITCVTVGASMGTGDAVCQWLSQREFDWERVKKMWGIGTFISAPISHSFQYVLERGLPGNTVVRMVEKTVASSVFAFFVSLPVMFTATTLLAKDSNGKRSKTLDDALDAIRCKLIPTFAAGVFYWPFWNMVIYRFVSLDRRAIASSMVGVIWNVYLSSKANSP